ncbi:MAG: phosphate ABC transporter permease subunit PstC [Acidobacteriota bacterium]|nr:phosphate ABC transporter permease subunit PstC [Blastocatellia bacterium]MDW8238794.1 phosphate ABC transporter permease subunit PstC [Acidobacteriota bacterium]
MTEQATIALAVQAAHSRRRHIVNRLAQTVITLLALTAIVTIVLIFVFVFREALPILTDARIQQEASLSKLFLPLAELREATRFMWQPIGGVVAKYSLVPLVVGTLKTTIVALVFAAPLGIMAAVYTSEFSPSRLREWIKPTIELLAGIPSVVLGFFALIVLASWMQGVFGFQFRLNAMTAGVALALAVVPIIYSVSEDALTAVPRSYREASLALGASRWQTAVHVVVPAALPGIFASVVLGFGRAIGETMIVLMASGNAAVTSWSLTDSTRTLAATIAAELGEAVLGSPHYHVLFFIGALLFIVTFLTNSFGAWVVGRMRRRLTGGVS